MSIGFGIRGTNVPPRFLPPPPPPPPLPDCPPPPLLPNPQVTLPDTLAPLSRPWSWFPPLPLCGAYPFVGYCGSFLNKLPLPKNQCGYPAPSLGTRARVPARARAHETRPPTIPLYHADHSPYKVAVERSGPMRSGSMGPGDVTSHHIGLMSALMTRSSASLLWPDGRERERDA